MANLILASEFTSKQTGAQMWHVYRSNEGEKSSEFFFYQPLKALRYAFLLRKRGGGFIPKAIYNKLMAAVKADKPTAAPAAEEPKPEPEAEEPSPVMRQYAEMKAKHTDAVLLFRNGDFYEAYGDDAVAVSEILGLTLTRIDEFFHYEKPAYMTGFPFHALDSYLPRLVRAGKRVAICDGLPEPQPEKKPARRRSTKKAENK